MGTVLEWLQAIKEAWSYVGDYVCYKKILDENMTTLSENMKTLSDHEEDINQQLTFGESLGGKKRKRVVETWLKDVQDKRIKTQDKQRHANERRYFRRSQFLRLVEEKIKEVNDLIERGTFPGGLLNDVHQDRVVKFGTTRLVGQSIKKNMKTILNGVENGTSIGVWGMGGSGKTTVVTHVNNELLKKRESFGPVYWVTVSDDLDVYKLQDKIANVLNLGDFSKEEDKQRRAAVLSENLREREKFVLILDDIWKDFRLVEVGIPIGMNAGKLILTSRSRDVCERMGCQLIIQVEPLVEEEAWDLFMENLGQRVFASNVEECAKSFVKECCGLPLAIITVAGSMKGMKRIHRWRTALKKFKEYTKGLNDDMKSKVIGCLKFSYDGLNDEKLKQCFLYCAFFPEDYEIKRKDLITYWIAEGLVDEMETRQEEFDRGHDLLDKLEDVCLLEHITNIDGENCVKMHDLIRDLALKITAESSKFMVKAGVQLTELPNERHWSENLERVSLMNSETIRQFSCISPKCPRLCTLMLRSISHIKEIPNSLFLYLQNLRVLELSNLKDVERLPDSISNLDKLRALLLRGCYGLRYVPSVAKLTELWELNIGGTRIEKLPHGLEKLVKLKSLLLEFTITDDEQVKEICSLEQLEVLSVTFQSLRLFTSYAKTQNCCQRRLSRYLLQIGSSKSYEYVRCRQVYVRNYDSIGGGGGDSLDLFTNNMQELWIESRKDITSLWDISSSLNAEKLERCRITRCNGIEQLMPWRPIPSVEKKCTNTSSFQRLRTLMLDALHNLRVIFNIKEAGIGGYGTFSNLKLLIIFGCDNLPYVLTDRLVQQHLQNLELIHVNYCNQMEMIIVAENEEDEEGITENEVTCPKLQRLELVHLRRLTSIWSGTMVCPSLQLIRVERCPDLKRLPFSPHSKTSSTLQTINGRQRWWNSLIWDHPDDKSFFQLVSPPNNPQQKIVIKVQMTCDKCRSEAMKIAEVAEGVTSVAIAGANRDKLVVTGDGVDSSRLNKSLREKVGCASIVCVAMEEDETAHEIWNDDLKHYEEY